MQHNCYTCTNKKELYNSENVECTVQNKEKSLQTAVISNFSLTPLGFKEDFNNPKPIIELNKIGVEGGWCLYPLNYDPRWITSCLLYDEKIDSPYSVKIDLSNLKLDE